MTRAVALTLLLLGAAVSRTQEKPGPLPDGSVLLNSGWKIKPAGDSVAVDTLPMRSAMAANGKYLLVLNGGAHPPSVSVLDVAAKRELSRTPLPDAWFGLAVSPQGDVAYVGGGGSGKVFELALSPDGQLTRAREFDVPDSKLPGAPFIGDVALSPDGRVLYAADLYGDMIAQVNLQSGKMVDHWRTGRRPYRIVVSPDGAHLLITSWAEGAVYEHESGTGVLVTKLRVGPQPTDMLWLNKPVSGSEGGAGYAGRVFVATANTNSVATLGVMADGQLRTAEPINVSMTPMHPLGMTPSGLATDRHGSRLYVSCSDANALAVVDISTTQPRLFGFIPTGWYPVAVSVFKDDELAVVNGKGRSVQLLPVQLVPSSGLDHLPEWTQTVMANSPYRDDLIYGPVRDAQEAFFSKLQEHGSPIQHVIYVLRGAVRASGPGTPNLDALARQFIKYDNFFSNGDTEIEGQNWLAAAIAPGYTVKLAPSVIAGRSKVRDFEGGELANNPPAGYLWSNALQAGITVRNYGEWVTNASPASTAEAPQVKAVNDPSLARYTDMAFRGADPAYKDTDRAREFVRDWQQLDGSGQTPQLAMVRLSGSSEGDNDAAIGSVAEAVSHSKAWNSTAIFVVDAASDAGSGYHAQCWALSPYTRRGTTDSTMYTQAGVLRTIELILGLRPMTHFDAASRALFGGFSQQPNPQAFNAVGSASQ